MRPHISIDQKTLAEFCQKYYIKRLAIFGSALLDDFRPESDVDVLVEFQPGHVPGLDFIAIEHELSGLLQGMRVTRTRCSVRHRARLHVATDARVASR